MGLIHDLGRGPVALDTAVFIYFIEEHPAYFGAIEPVFAAIDGGRLQAVTSAVTLLETLVIPYRAGNTALAEEYEAILTRSRGLRLVDLDRPLLRSAAHLRAVTCVRTPDAIQLATALQCRCSALITNDRTLPEFPGLRIRQLADYAVSR